MTTDTRRRDDSGHPAPDTPAAGNDLNPALERLTDLERRSLLAEQARQQAHRLRTPLSVIELIAETLQLGFVLQPSLRRLLVQPRITGAPTFATRIRSRHMPKTIDPTAAAGAAGIRARAGFPVSHPRDIVDRQDLSDARKIALLQQWEQDVREEMVAEEEAMTGPNGPPGDMLQEILQSLDRLGVADHSRPVPDKLG